MDGDVMTDNSTGALRIDRSAINRRIERLHVSADMKVLLS